MMSLATLSLLATIIMGPPPTGASAETLTRFEQQCTGATLAKDCPELRRQVEHQLLLDLLELDAAGRPLDRAVLRSAALADFPLLAWRALLWLAPAATKEDAETFVAALDHPARGVRSQAAMLLRRVMPEESGQLLSWFDSAGASGDDVDDEGAMNFDVGLVPDAVPDERLLGGPIYPKAQYRYAASGKTRALFTTSDPVTAVVAALGKGKKVMPAADFLDKASSAMKMPSNETLKKAQEMIEKSAGNGEIIAKAMEMMKPTGTELMSGFAMLAANLEVQYVILSETPTLRAVAVWADNDLGQTVILYPLLDTKH